MCRECELFGSVKSRNASRTFQNLAKPHEPARVYRAGSIHKWGVLPVGSASHDFNYRHLLLEFNQVLAVKKEYVVFFWTQFKRLVKSILLMPLCKYFAFYS